MGFRFRKSFKIAPGMRMNLSKSGIGISVGSKYGRVSIHSSGRRTISSNLPGTGISYVHTTGGHRSRRMARASRPITPAAHTTGNLRSRPTAPPSYSPVSLLLLPLYLLWWPLLLLWKICLGTGRLAVVAATHYNRSPFARHVPLWQAAIIVFAGLVLCRLAIAIFGY
jgi:hypothetical protein